MRRQLGVNTWVWTSPTDTAAVETYVPKARAMGFDMIELGIEDMTALDYARAREILTEHACGVSATVVMAPGRDLVDDDPHVRAATVAYVRHCVDACATMGARNLSGPIYATVGRTWRQTPDERAATLDMLCGHLIDLATYAHDHGVVLGLEPLNRFETSLVNTAEQVMEIVDRVDHPGCGVLLDTFHMNIEEKSLGGAIRRCGDKLVHLHTCENDRGAPGTGNVPWDDVSQALDDIGYDGPLVIESFTSDVVSIARAAAVWRSFEPSQDALAETGLRFLRDRLA